MVGDWRAALMATLTAPGAPEAPPAVAPLPEVVVGGNAGNTENRRAIEVELQLLQSKNHGMMYPSACQLQSLCIQKAYPLLQSLIRGRIRPHRLRLHKVLDDLSEHAPSRCGCETSSAIMP
ncbi:hypothetical protein Salat_1655500 [Sesamum alatum]|uniref:Uncharacterized protein n=1 Tax=Sesamum alatum TaxID=300844 RepID=A0AAE1Y756_9LAMI|nr:hypothetical protein Salat_1655500 [Sesamum alatum]